jgi:phosphatidylserine/phosphatidylglycerophosphate/cardiolipin synthase-like enzyme
VGVFDLENKAGVPVYVHAKVCIVDDTWFTCGSDNFNLRSWTMDSELTCAVMETSAGDESAGQSPSRLARDLRAQLWAEHLGLEQDDPRLADDTGLTLWNATADALEQWHAGDGTAPRPAGAVRRHAVERVSRMQRLWAVPLNRLLLDPDARPRRLRGTSTF